jgi:hypothetical protein
MKPPYFPDPPKPKEASPYREPQPKPEASRDEPPAVVVSRPEPLLEEEPVVARRTAPTKDAGAQVTHMEARALLAVDRNRHTQYFRARLLVLPLTLVLWRYGRMLGAIQWLVYPLLALSIVLVVLEIKRIWRRTEL